MTHIVGLYNHAVMESVLLVMSQKALKLLPQLSSSSAMQRLGWKCTSAKVECKEWLQVEKLSSGRLFFRFFCIF